MAYCYTRVLHMAIPMSRPASRLTSKNLYFRERIPKDVIDKARGQTVVLPVGDDTIRLTIRPKAEAVMVSLRTSDIRVSKTRRNAVSDHLSHWYDQLRTGAAKGTTTLSHMQCVALAGEIYSAVKSGREQDPLIEQPDHLPPALRVHPIDPDRRLTPAVFDGLQSFFSGGPHAVLAEEHGIEPVAILSPFVDHVLARHGLVVDQASRDRLGEQVRQAFLLAADRLKQNALGDYSPDKNASRWPPFQAAKPSNVVTFDSLVDGWAKEADPKQATVDQWRSHLRNLVEVTGVTDGAKLTAGHVLQWKDALLDRGLAATTINGSYLAALSKVLTWGEKNGKLKANVAKGISVDRKRKAGSKMLGFSDEQAAAILAAASASTVPAYRWLPWLCCLHGCRVGEVSQLRRSDIRTDRSGIHYMRITAEAGSVKNEGSERDVPLHPHMTDIGFLAFVEGCKEGPLFYDPSKRKNADAKKPQSKIVSKNVAAWIRGLGIAGVGRANRVDPSHAWRHRFKSQCDEAEISDRVSDAITGHAADTEGKKYGEQSLSAKLTALRKITPPVV